MMYACGHDQNGERNLEYEELLPHQRMPMSNGQCPKCVDLRNRVNLNNYEVGIRQYDPPRIIAPDPEILAIMRLFLEKYEILAAKDREMYSKAILALVNPQLSFDGNMGEDE